MLIAVLLGVNSLAGGGDGAVTRSMGASIAVARPRLPPVWELSNIFVYHVMAREAAVD